MNVCVCMCVLVYTRIVDNMKNSACVCVYVCAYRIYTHIFDIHTYIHVQVTACLGFAESMKNHVIFTHTYTHTHKHTYIHTYTGDRMPRLCG